MTIRKADSQVSTGKLPLAALKRAAGLLALGAALALLAPSAALAVPPLVSQTSFSSVTETGATLSAAVNPTGGITNVHFDYTSLAEYKAHAFEGAKTAPAEDITLPGSVKGSGNLQAASDLITGVSTTAAGGAFGVGQTITATGIPAGTTVKAVEAEPNTNTLTLKISQPATATVAGANLTATGPQPVSAAVAGLSPGIGYVFRASAVKLSGEEGHGTATTFYTYAAPPTFASCPNDPLRSGPYAPPSAPAALLPDCRSFELASPLEKNGNDVLSVPGYSRVADDGSAITFGSTFGIPGATGAQATAFLQASRDKQGSGWSTSGLMPPASAGSQTQILIGQLPDLSATYATASRLGAPTVTAVFELHRDGTPPTQVTPYVPSGLKDFGIAGASADGNTVLIESLTALPQEEGGAPIPGSAAGAPNVYAWDRQSQQLRLASVMNTPAQTAEALAKGAYAGPYNWISKSLTREGGAAGGYYLTDEHAVGRDGSVFFTSRSTGHLYERVNPMQLQSELGPQGCTQPAKACTLDISASRRSTPDSAGAQPAAFQAATADGSQVFFTSSEKLTDDANTGPEQPAARIGRATLNGSAAATEEIEEFTPGHAAGVTVDPKGEYIYWADPSKGTIGRAKLEGSEAVDPEPSFIEPGPVDFTIERPDYPGAGLVTEHVSGESAPRYLAVNEQFVYWTSSGPPNSPVEGQPVYYHGSIGRAKLNGEDVEPAFIVGTNSPEGIALNSEYIYWANAAFNRPGISRAPIAGGAPDLFIPQNAGGYRPYGLAIDGSHLYAAEETNSDQGYIQRYLLNGDAAGSYSVGTDAEAGIRGLAIDDEYLYWSSRSNLEIGRIAIDKVSGGCEPSFCNNQFLTPEGAVVGLATNSAHLYWSANGEAPPNSGNDLYRYQPGAAEPLKDLTPDSSGNGAEVLGVLGTSSDGSYIYFAANADLDGAGEAEAGDCSGAIFQSTKGECSIYLYHQGQIEFVARVDLQESGRSQADWVNWLPQARLESSGFIGSRQKASLVSADGKTLVFSSQRQLTSYDNHLVAEFYRYRPGQGISCLTCVPTGAAPRSDGFGRPAFGSLTFTFINPGNMNAAFRVGFASQNGDRLFFESPEAMVGYDTDAANGCPNIGVVISVPSCLDVYEWTAPGTGNCTVAGPGYSQQNEGCIYLLSQGSGSDPAFFANASPSGDDVYVFTRAQLVGEDTDELRDVYDARVDGGLVSQNQAPISPCEAESCRPGATAPPPFQAPPHFSGPPDPKPTRCKGKRCHKKKGHKKKAHKQTSKQHKTNHRLGGGK